MKTFVTCHDVDTLMTPYLDGEAGSQDRAAVEAHLGQCPACHDHARAEGAAKRVLRERAASVVGQAPLGLRTRTAAAAARSRETRRWPLSRLVTAPIAAAVVLLAVVALYGLAGRSSVLLAAQLTLDHLKCFSLFEGQSGPPDSKVLEARLHDDYGWHMTVPAGSRSAGLALTGARRCFYHSGRIAHVMYRQDGNPVSLFMLPRTARLAETVRILGHESRIWSVGNTTYVLVAQVPKAQLDRVEAHLRGSMR
jgi:anti-sigma factor (TIGR02949 family)